MILPSGISTSDYSRLANSKGWGRGWPSCDAINAGQIAQIKATRSGATIAGGVHRNIAELCTLIINEIERRGYLLHPGWNWGAECRAISGSSTPSNHSWGLAMDLNAPNNPYTSSGVHDIPDWAYALFRQYGFGLGADYSGKKDWMHTEFLGNPSDAAIMTGLARQNLGGGIIVPPEPAKEWDELATEAQIRAIVADEVAKQGKTTRDYVNQILRDRTKGSQSIYDEGRYNTQDVIIPALNNLRDLLIAPEFQGPGHTFRDEVQWSAKNQVIPAITGEPPVPDTPAIPDTYTVQAGDTLSGIASKYGLSKDDIAAWNSIADQNNIGIGQVLKLHP